MEVAGSAFTAVCAGCTCFHPSHAVVLHHGGVLCACGVNMLLTFEIGFFARPSHQADWTLTQEFEFNYQPAQCVLLAGL